MTGTELPTSNPNITLVPIDIERDAPIGEHWLRGDIGRETLRLMGTAPENNHPSTIEAERERLQEILDNPNEVAWMIAYENKVVGIVEVATEGTEYIPGPAISIMIGDTSTRGQGVGLNSINAVMEYLFEKGYPKLYARHLTDNNISAGLLARTGFTSEGEPYRDTDKLEWQNVSMIQAGAKQDEDL